MEWLELPINVLYGVTLLQALVTLLATWCFPRWDENRFLAWFSAARAMGPERRYRTGFACWLMAGLTGLMLMRHEHILAGLALVAVFFLLSYLLRDRLYRARQG